MDQINRITHMEQILDQASLAVENLSAALEAYCDMGGQLQQLFDYYFGPQWRQDFEDDCCGRLPSHLKRGVLSEDGVYNLFLRNREVLHCMKDLTGEK